MNKKNKKDFKKILQGKLKSSKTEKKSILLESEEFSIEKNSGKFAAQYGNPVKVSVKPNKK